MRTLKFIRVFLLLGLLISSCGKGENDNSEKDTSNSEANNAATVVKEGKNLQNNIKDLRNTIPLTNAQFEAWLPQTLNGLPITFSQINFMPGLSSCGATYKIENKRIRIMIIDGAGEKGAGGVGPYRMSSKMDYHTEDTWGYTKTRIINGIKVKESYNKSANSYSVSMFYAERFAVDIETHKIEQTELEHIIKELNLDKLSDL